jgi:hypothetical protein
LNTTNEEDIEKMVKELEDRRREFLNRSGELESEKEGDPLQRALEGDDEYVKRLAQLAMNSLPAPGVPPSKEDLQLETEYFQKLAKLAVKPPGKSPSNSISENKEKRDSLPSFWWKWFLAASALVMLFGVLMVFFNNTLLEPIGRDNYNSFFEDEPFEALSFDELRFQNWVFGVIGTVTIGWGVILFFVVYHPLKRREQWAWNALAVSIIVWFVLDTGVSLYHGVVLNAIANTGFFILFVIPLIKLKNYF